MPNRFVSRFEPDSPLAIDPGEATMRLLRRYEPMGKRGRRQFLAANERRKLRHWKSAIAESLLPRPGGISLPLVTALSTTFGKVLP